MALKRFTSSVDGTIPVQALLFDDETLLTSQEGVGIYDGPQKAPHHQSGTVYATTHRLFYVDGAHPFSRSFLLDLEHVGRTEYYAGLFTSSAKATLYLNSPPTPAQPQAQPPSSSTSLSQPPPKPSTPNREVEFWECGMSKTPINIPTKATPPLSSISTSLPSSSFNLARLSLSTSTSPAPSPPVPAVASSTGEIACVACTFINSPLLRECEICGTALPKPAPQEQPILPAAVRSAPASRSATPQPDSDDDWDDDSPEKRMIRLSFRKGGDKPFYNVLRRSILGKAWKSKSTSAAADSSAVGSSSRPLGRSGINGILRSVETTAATSQSNMEDSLADLEALMVKWKDMVKLSQDLNERLTAASSTPSASAPVEPEEATFIRSSLAQLGLQMSNAPVTQDMVRDERAWYEGLARELAGVLEGSGAAGKGGEGIMRRRGIVGLDGVWGGWNRARGVALIPPNTFLQVLPLLPSFTNPPIQMRTFAASGLSVLHTPPYGAAAFTARLVGILTHTGPRTTVEIATAEDLPIGLTQEMVDEAERAGDVCRDEGGAGVALFSGGAGGAEVRWWPNVFREYVWDGQLVLDA
ncbi:EAP30/Vps36 family-domain-containing protein [Epithele typhae]|uniref:EAP30/Vps36 family-domain-containing protein n=1 Tax=Epithele typhae TaxID=378194 RepID=UPI0020072BCD|nr:EAP30/Vps36 family-domain-containing protein [Epithele typhae]KAH9916404.1 EAP30/Vps36 family-domain-containing protein [Epithele typhae]